MIIDGRKIADGILEQLMGPPKPKKFLAAVLVGDDAASVSFLKQKENTAKKLGVDFRLYRFSSEIKNDALRREVGKIAAHKTCGGVIVQLPMPDHLNWYYILNAIPPGKDIEVLGERALGAFYTGRSRVLPPAAGVVESICADRHYDLAAHSVAVVGLGFLVGHPIANWIMRRAKETFLIRSTSDIALAGLADCVIVGVGKAGLINPAMLKDGGAVIDFGYAAPNGKISGDFKTDLPEEHYKKLMFYTPTPGGTGPILVAKIFENFYKLNPS